MTNTISAGMMIEFPMLRNGILLGLIFSAVGMVVFAWTMAHAVRWVPSIVGSFLPFLTRFVTGILIGTVIPVAIFLGIRYAVILHYSKNLPR